MTAGATVSTRLAALHRAVAHLRASADAELVAIGDLLDARPADEVARFLGIENDRTAAAIAERNRLLAMAADLLPTEMSIRQKAERLRELLVRYRAGRWKNADRLLRDCPYGASIEAVLWRLLRVRDAAPGPELIRKIIGG